MSSFSKPMTAWRDAEAALNERLEMVARRQREFPAVEQRLRRVVDMIARSGTLNLPNGQAPALVHAPFEPSQALSFRLRGHVNEEFTGHRRVLQAIHDRGGDFEVTPEQICRWHLDAMGPAVGHGGMFKQEENVLPDRRADGIWHGSTPTVAAAQAPAALAELCAAFTRQWDKRRVPRILSVGAITLDFFQVHPFTDGNGRTARLLLLALLLKLGHRALCFQSLEGAVSRNRQAYLMALHESQAGWHQARHDFTPWLRFILDLVAGAYERVGQRTEELESFAEGAETLRCEK
jgi:fido (protein-threonine AMPylation protein)